MWDRVSKWKREHTGNWGKCVEGLFCGKLVFDRAGGAVPPVCIAAGKSDAWPERFRGDIWGGGAADTFLAKGCRDLAGSSCVGRVWRDICSRQPDFNDIPFDLDGICGHKGVFCKFKKGRHPSHPDFCWKPLSVQCPAGIYRWIYQLVQAGGRAVPDSFFAGSDPDGRADGSKGQHALLGMGLMLSAGEVPRIAGQFGLDTTTRANVTGAFYAAQGAINLTRSVVQAITVK